MKPDGRVRHLSMFVHVLDDRAVSRLNLALCAELRAAGVDMSLICTTRAQGSAVQIPEGIAVHDLALGGRPTALGVPKLASLLPRLRPDVVFAHGNGPGRAAIAARALARASCGVVVVEHTHYATFYKKRLWLRDRATAWLYPHADRVGGVSSGVVRNLEERFPGVERKTVVLPAIGPDEAAVARAAAERPDHPWYARDNGVRLICSVANLVPRKGQAVLVEALPLIREAAGDVRLVLVGRFDDQPFVDRLRRRAHELGIADQVWFAGYRANALPFIAHADVFALASQTEGAAMVLTEAMACGVPVVSTDCPVGPSFLLDEGRSGLLVPVDDPPRLAEALARVLTEPSLRGDLIARGRERAAQFTSAAVARRYLAVAGEVLERRDGTDL